MTRVLFTGGGGAGMELLWRLLHGKYELWFCDHDAANFSPAIPAERRRDGFGNIVHDILVPGIDHELGWMAELSDGVLVPSVAFVSLMLDKQRAMSALREKGISTPRTWIVKPNAGRGSRGVEIIQEHLEGQEYTVTVSADQQGKLHAIAPVKVELKKGVTIRGVTERQPDVVKACKQIHNAFPTRGTYNVQGVLTRDGFSVFEINPRFSTTTPLAIAAGVDPIAIWLGTERSPTWKEGVRLSRTWHNALL